MKFYLIIFLNFIFGQSIASKVDSIIKPQIRSSAIAIANTKAADNHYIKCTYGQPLKKGRQVFGGLVPYDKLWRTGANEATEITFTCNLKIGDKLLNAGTYSVFSIPRKDSWTIIFNSALGQWGDFTYDPSKDVLRVEIKPQNNQDIYEGFTIELIEDSDKININLLWDDVLVSIPALIVQDSIVPSTKKKRKKK